MRMSDSTPTQNYHTDKQPPGKSGQKRIKCGRKKMFHGVIDGSVWHERILVLQERVHLRRHMRCFGDPKALHASSHIYRVLRRRGEVVRSTSIGGKHKS